MSVSLRQLEYLTAVDEHRNFTRAATACSVTQPSLSEQLRLLEASLGVALFERERRPIGLTPAGLEIAAQARQVLEEVRRMQDLAHRFREPLCGTLHLGVIPTIAPYVLPSCMASIRERFPSLRLYLREDQTSRLLEQLESGQLDVLLLALEADLGDVETRALTLDPFVLAAPTSHPLAQRDSVTEEDLADQHVLLLDDGHCLRDQALAACDKANTKDVDNFRAGSLRTLVQMVASGLGVTLIPSIASSIEVASASEGGVSVRPFADPAPRRTIGIAWRKQSARAEEFDQLGECIRAAMQLRGQPA